MAGFSSADAAKEYAAEYIHAKLWGANPGSTSDSWTDVDPGGTPPTDPGDPPDDPDSNDVETYVMAWLKHMMATIRDKWDAGNP